MATTQVQIEQYTSDSFVESAGAVLFRPQTKEICILRILTTNQYVLPKGRRNCSESVREAAVREVIEETGVRCRLVPLNMLTRAPPAVEIEQLPDQARFYHGVTEPFMLQVRRLGEKGVKLVWWFVAMVEEAKGKQGGQVHEEADRFAVEFCGYAQAVEKLTYKLDKEVVQKAIELMKGTYPENDAR